MPECSKILVNVANLVFFIFGTIVAGFSIKAATVYKDNFEELEGHEAIVAAIIFGFGLIIFSVIGCAGTFYDSKILLLIYSIGIFAMAVGVLVVGGLLISFNKNVDDTKDGKPDNDRQEIFLDFVYASFEQCCEIDVQQCNELLTNFCINDQERVDDFKSGMEDGQFCDALEKIEVDGHKLVGPVLDGSCGGATLTIGYVRDFVDVIDQNMGSLAIGSIVAGVIILVLLVASCALLWSDSRKGKPAHIEATV